MVLIVLDSKILKSDSRDSLKKPLFFFFLRGKVVKTLNTFLKK